MKVLLLKLNHYIQLVPDWLPGFGNYDRGGISSGCCYTVLQDTHTDDKDESIKLYLFHSLNSPCVFL